MSRVEFNLPVSAVNVRGLAEAAERYARSGNEACRPSSNLLPPDEHVLAFETIVVRFRIGRALSKTQSAEDSEVGVFEILNSQDLCVGEVMTTYGRARFRRGSNDFLTISWGLSLQHAETHDAYIPCWRFSSKGSKKSFRSLFNDDDALARLMGEDMAGHVAPLFLNPLLQKYSRYIPKETILKYGSAGTPSMSGSKLCEKVYFAQKGQPRPRSLWTVVNVMLVDWNGHLVRCAGVGKVIMGAWRESRTPLQEVISALGTKTGDMLILGIRALASWMRT